MSEIYQWCDYNHDIKQISLGSGNPSGRLVHNDNLTLKVKHHEFRLGRIANYFGCCYKEHEWENGFRQVKLESTSWGYL